MTTSPLIVSGTFAVKDENHATPTYQDFSDAITKVQILATANEVAIPSTLATPESSRKGAVKYQLVLDYFANDVNQFSELYGLFWQAVTTGSGQMDFSVRLRPGVASATNPVWTGTLVVLQTQLGGDVNTLSVGSATFPLVGQPVRNISEPS